MPEVVVAVVLNGGRILLIQRGVGVPDAGYWAPPGGEVEPAESQAAAVIREVREEVGLTIRPLRKVWESLSTRGTHRLHWWLAEYVGGELMLNPREVNDARWLTVDETLNLAQLFGRDREFFTGVFPRL